MTQALSTGSGGVGSRDAFEQATIYLAEPSVTTFGDLIRTAEAEAEPTCVQYRLARETGLDGVVCVAQYGVAEPAWKSSLASLVGVDLPGVAVQQAGAVLLLRLAGRIFAFSFGQGRHLLNRDLLVDDFGVRVAANTVDPLQIRSVDGRAFERGVLLTRRQASRPGRVEALGLQVDREMFSAITGRSRRAGEGRIHGGTSLGLTRAMPFNALESLGAELLTAYAATEYRSAFPSLDRLRPLARNDAAIPRLVARLLADLRSPDRTAFLAPPSILDWEHVSGFRLSTQPRGPVLDEPDIREYLASLSAPPTANDLASDEVRVVDRDSPRVSGRAAIVRWLVWETVLDEQAYVLSDGRWYRIDNAYIEWVDRLVATVGRPAFDLPRPSRSNMAEGSYNAEAATALGGVLLDRELARVGTERGGFELCDIFVPPNRLVHVKRGLGSQELTYLFSQGIQSAEGLRHAREVRQRLVELVGRTDAAAASMLPLDRRPTAGELEVVYAIVTGAPGRVPADLPFFARATLARAVRTLEDFDFACSAAGVMARP